MIYIKGFYLRLFFLCSAFVLSAGGKTLLADQGNRLAFVANVDGNWDIFLADEDGTNTVRLTQTPFDENEPRWSPDRKQLVYSTADGQIQLIDLDSKETRILETGAKNEQQLNPSFSPDGKQIVYVRCKPKKADDTALYIFNLEDKSNRLLLEQYTPQYFPVWSPDGEHIAYINIHCSSECGQIIQELWLTEPRAGYARQLLMTNSQCMQPVWSSDGKRIAFASDKNGNFDVWVCSLENGQAQELASGPDSETGPAWSPDGGKIAYISTKAGRTQIAVKNLKSGEIKTLAPFGNDAVDCRDVAW